MEAVFLIGQNCYPKRTERIFAHQIVDGFIIVSGFGGDTFEMPVAVSIALLRHVAAGGKGFAKASIGEGDSADYTGCYPQQVLDARENVYPDGREKRGRVRMGGGKMTLFTVFGTAHIDAYEVYKKSPSGSLLTVASCKRDLLPKECVAKEVSCGKLLSIDWVHSDLELVHEIQKRAGLKMPSSENLEQLFASYIATPNRPPEHWVNSTSQLLNLSY